MPPMTYGGEDDLSADRLHGRPITGCLGEEDRRPRPSDERGNGTRSAACKACTASPRKATLVAITNTTAMFMNVLMWEPFDRGGT